MSEPVEEPCGGGCEAFARDSGTHEHTTCCSSCHEDDEDGYSELCTAHFGGKWYAVCCRMVEDKVTPPPGASG